MKKIIFIISILLFFSCMQKQTINPPKLTVSPSDTFLTISVIAPLDFDVQGFDQEDLYRLKITTLPNIFEVDSVFPAFTHELHKKFTIKIGDDIAGLPDDSIVVVTFSLSNHYKSAEQTKYIKVESGYGKIITDTVNFYYAKDSAFFYCFDLMTKLDFNYVNQNSHIHDFSFIYDETDGFVLASPDAYYNNVKLSGLGYNYSNIDQKQTLFNKFSTDYDYVDAKFLYVMTVQGSYIDDNEGNGYGEANLQPGDILGFRLEDGRKGVIKILTTDATNKKLILTYKLQEKAIE